MKTFIFRSLRFFTHPRQLFIYLIAVFLVGFVFTIIFTNIGFRQSLVIAANECNDSIDNDGDGLIDWQYDLGCYNSSDPTEGNSNPNTLENGWTVFEKASGAKVIYVSSSGGNDSNDGLSPQTPVKTITKGKSLLRSGEGDWLLLKRGDTWYDGLGYWTFAGKSEDYPMVIASYGDSIQRPLLRLKGTDVLFSRDLNHIKNLTYVVIKGLYFDGYTRDITSSEFDSTVGKGFSVAGQGNYLLIEDNRFGYIGPIAIDVQNGLSNLLIRRNVIHNSYTTGKTPGGEHSQGLFLANLNGILIEENVIDYNGWNAGFLLAINPLTTDLNSWKAITGGAFNITLELTEKNISGLNFSSINSLSDAAIIMESAINTKLAADGDSRRVSFSYRGSQFILTSNNFRQVAHSSPDGSGYEVSSATSGGTNIVGTLLRDVGTNPSGTKFNHNMYVQYNNTGTIVVKGNIVSRASSHGLQLRPGGTIENNLFVDNAIHFYAANTPSTIKNNVVLGGKNIDYTQIRGWGISVQNQTGSLVENNIVAHKTSAQAGKAYALSVSDAEGGSYNTIFRNNIVYNWYAPGGILSVSNSIFNNVVFDNNKIYDSQGGNQLVWGRTDVLGSLVTFTNNKYYSVDGDASDFLLSTPSIGGKVVNFATWQEISGESGSYGQFSLPDPNRNISSYMAFIGKSGQGFEGFVEEAKKQSRFNWRSQYTAAAVNDYIRAGFGLSTSSPAPTPAPTPTPTCSESWSCTTWSACSSGTQSRTCTDANSCGTQASKPATSQSCSSTCSPNWSCSSWNTCSNSTQSRTCTDLNNCGTNQGHPGAQRVCVYDPNAKEPAPAGTEEQAPETNKDNTAAGSLIKEPGSPRVYLITSNGQKRYIPKEGIFLANRFYWNQIKPVTKEVLDAFPTDAELTYPEKALIKSPGNPAVYVYQNGNRGVFFNAKHFLANNFRWTDIVVVSQEDLNNIPLKFNVKYPDGSLLKGFAPEVYLIQDGVRRKFATAEAFAGLGFKWQNIINVSDFELTFYSEGPPIQSITDSSKSILTNIDSDNDGLYDYLELIHGTDINKADTDGDGYDDASELRAGRNPLGV